MRNVFLLRYLPFLPFYEVRKLHACGDWADPFSLRVRYSVFGCVRLNEVFLIQPFLRMIEAQNSLDILKPIARGEPATPGAGPGVNPPSVEVRGFRLDTNEV